MKSTLITLSFFCTFATAQDCYRSMVQSPTPFMGNNGEIAKLTDGSIWEIQYEYEYMYEYYPSVIACPSRGVLVVKDKKLTARLISGGPGATKTNVIESYIESSFSGLNMGNIYRLSNGQIWEQTEAWIWYWSWSRPKVMLYTDGGITKMKVENIDHAVSVRRLK
jgi:hypothetical protein